MFIDCDLAGCALVLKYKVNLHTYMNNNKPKQMNQSGPILYMKYTIKSTAHNV